MEKIWGKKRIEWVDFLRGIAMLLVILGHIAKNSYFFFLITSPFKMPLFFSITGYLFSDKNGDIKKFLKGLFFHIIVPWLLLSLIWLRIPYYIVTGKAGFITEYLYKFFSGEILWFIPCFIIAEILQFTIRKMTGNFLLRCAIIGCVGIAGIVLSQVGIGRFAMFDVACISQLFILFGFWYRKQEDRIIKLNKWPVLGGVLLAHTSLVFLSMSLYPGEIIDVHNSDYYNYAICGGLIGLSLFGLFFAVRDLPRFPKWIVFVGQNTLTFYIAHYYARSVFSQLLAIFRFNLPDSIWAVLVEFVFVCVLMTIASLVLNRWLPFVVGKRRR